MMDEYCDLNENKYILKLYSSYLLKAINFLNEYALHNEFVSDILKTDDLLKIILNFDMYDIKYGGFDDIDLSGHNKIVSLLYTAAIIVSYSILLPLKYAVLKSI